MQQEKYQGRLEGTNIKEKKMNLSQVRQIVGKVR